MILAWQLLLTTLTHPKFSEAVSSLVQIAEVLPRLEQEPARRQRKLSSVPTVLSRVLQLDHLLDKVIAAVEAHANKQERRPLLTRTVSQVFSILQFMDSLLKLPGLHHVMIMMSRGHRFRATSSAHGIKSRA